MNNSLQGNGIRVTSRANKIYPEVTGYLVPSLITWGEREIAHKYIKHLTETQDEDGSFSDPSDTSKCVFDTGQVLRGFLAYMEVEDDADVLIATQKSINWITSLISTDGKIEIPEKRIWGGVVPDEIVLYALEPALRAAQRIGSLEQVEKIKSAIELMVNDKSILKHRSLNHFHAYIVEALIDLGYLEDANKAFDEITVNMTRNGFVPAFPGGKWSCSTGQFQYAVIAYKLGKSQVGDLLMDYGMRFQNSSGGWFGTNERRWAMLSSLNRIFPKLQTYFPADEIPWANKYFMDAMMWRLKSSFDLQSDLFSPHIDKQDGRVEILIRELSKHTPERYLDAGTGKGRYLIHVKMNFPSVQIYASDISQAVMSGLDPDIKKSTNLITNFPNPDESIDFISAIESLEHSVYLKGALKELWRILAPGGIVLIIDKNARFLGRLKLPKWEQWFFPRKLKYELEKIGFQVRYYNGIPFEKSNSKLFTCWVAKKL